MDRPKMATKHEIPELLVVIELEHEIPKHEMSPLYSWQRHQGWRRSERERPRVADALFSGSLVPDRFRLGSP